ncbi:MAG: type II toxin-antitoxin system RelE/ParE family toxin [Cardiobacteriaceae bacterium]|nr:type II toxin-antitoxin system RelE/ParE family toxin [Cardiobacteriaceae bacterium]
MQLFFSPLAEADLESIADYIAEDQPANALRFVRELREQCRRIADNPLAWRLRPELADNIRACPFRRYVIFFEYGDDGIRIVRILHGARDMSDMGFEDL